MARFHITALILLLPQALTLEVIKLENPFLPLNLGPGKLIYSTHAFIHYFNFLEIEPQLNLIKEDIDIIKNNFNTIKDEQSSVKEILGKINFKDLDYTYSLLEYKYNNLGPHIKKREKRGLINPIGGLYKFAFGLLDEQDGEHLENAIKVLDKNQRNLYASMNQQMSLSNKLIDRLNSSLSIIIKNQKEIAYHVDKLNLQVDNFVLISIKVLTLENLARQIINNCLTLIDLIEQLENAIMFAHLHVTHPSMIRSDEIQDMILTLKEYYAQDNVIEFNDLLSYYRILSTQVFFANGKIIFTVHFPLVSKADYNLFQIIPIPQHGILTYPNSFFLLNSTTQSLTIQEKCPDIENTYFCPQEEREIDDCSISTLRNQYPTNCSRRAVILKVTLIQKIDNNLIIVPKTNETMKIRCDSDVVKTISHPILIKLDDHCNVEINQAKYSFNKKKFYSKPLVLPKMENPADENLPEHKPIHLDDPRLDRIQDLKQMVKYPGPLIPLDYSSHTYTSLITFFGACITIISTLLWYHYCGCKTLKRKSKAKSRKSKDEPMVTYEVKETVLDYEHENQPLTSP